MLDLKIDHQYLQSHTLSFKVPLDDPKAHYLAEDVMLEFEDDLFIVDRVTKVRGGNEVYLSLEANAFWYRLGERKYVGNFALSNLKPIDGLARILVAAALDGIVWTVGQDLTDVTLRSMSVTDGTYLDLILQWAKICSCEVTFDTRHAKVNFGTNLGASHGFAFSYRRNLPGITREASAPKVTRLYAYGRQGLTIKGENPTGLEYIEDYSYYTSQGLTLPEARALYRKDETWRDDSFVDDAALYSAAVARLAQLAQPTVSYSASVVDLSLLSGFDEASFRVGDWVLVNDEVLGINVFTRVVRYVRYPYEPERNQVELSFIPVLVEDPNQSDGRSDAGQEWELFQHRNTDTPMSIRNGTFIIHYLPLVAQANADWVVNFKLQGLAVGASTVTYQPFDLVTGVSYWPTFTRTYSSGQMVDESFSFAQNELPAGNYIVGLRVYSDTAGAGVDVVAKATSMWILARGMVKQELTYDSSMTFNYTGAVQTFRVPDNVYEIQLEVYGAQGGNSATFDTTDARRGGYGEYAKGKIAVVPGSILDIYVGGRTSIGNGGWPNGGNGSSTSGAPYGHGGGGSSHVVPTGLSIIDAYLVAAGGGGAGFFYTGATTTGGYGGHFNGGDGVGTSNALGWNPTGAPSQYQGGQGGAGSDFGAGPWPRSVTAAGSFNQGGPGEYSPNAFSYPGGGGGGGIYGGGGASGNLAASFAGGSGGGGSGWASSLVLDLVIQNGVRSGNGQVIISWDNPTL